MTTSPLELGTRRVLVTGVTGFLGQAVLERILSDHPGVRVTCLVRPRGGLSGRARLLRLAHRPVFQRWRDEVGLAAVTAALTERCEALEGSVDDLAAAQGGGSQLAGFDVVVHSASEVAFDAPVDVSFATNVQGTATLCAALLAAGSRAHLVHVSTAYVAGEHRGLVPEARLEHDVDWRAEVACAAGARQRAEAASRTPEVLRELAARAARHDAGGGPQSLARAAEALRAAWVADQLVAAGRARARSLGWTDAYAHSKAMAERVVEEVWAGAQQRLTVLRPSIIESALRHPHPGWIDGYKTADPVIIAYGRGQLRDFPGLPESVFDLVPVDFVVNAVVAAAASPPPPASPAYLHVTTGASNPLPLHGLQRAMQRWFTEHPLRDARGPVLPPAWEFAGSRRLGRSTARTRRALAAAAWLLQHGPKTPTTTAALEGAQRRAVGLDLLRASNEVYAPYVQTQAVFGDAAASALQDALGLSPGDPRGFRAADVDWHHYLHEVHLPAITAATRAGERRPAAPRRLRSLPRPAPAGGGEPCTDVVVDLSALVPRRTVLAAQAALVLAVLQPERRTPAVMRWFSDLAAGVGSDPADQTRAVVRALRGVGAERLSEAAASPWVGPSLARSADRAVLDLLGRHRAAGHRVVLVSSAVDVLLAPLAHHVDAVRATPLHADGGLLTGYLGRPALAGEALAAWLLHGAGGDDGPRVDPRTTYGYGGAVHDAAWLSVVGQPVAVRPGSRLRRVAEQRRWPVLEQGASTAAWADLLPAQTTRAAEPAELASPVTSGVVIDLSDARARVRLPHQAVRDGSRVTDPA